MRRWAVHITFTAILTLGVHGVEAQKNPLVPTPPTDKFSRVFLEIYKDGQQSFMNVKGRPFKNGNLSIFLLKRNLPGSFDGYITGDSRPTCFFDFGDFKTREEAEAMMRKVTLKVSNSFNQKALVKAEDSVGIENVLKRTAVAEMINGGFYAYNIHVDLVKRGHTDDRNYGVEMRVASGSGTLYKVIWGNEPSRSSFFNKSFRTIYAQFDGAGEYYCNEQLPGYTCNKFDSSGKDQLMMEKHTDQLRDAQVEFEALSTNLRSVLGQKFLYYLPVCTDSVLSQIVFIRSDDYDKEQRRSISGILIKRNDDDYVIRLIMYHP